MNLLNNAVIRIPKQINEPINSFAPGSTARASLKEALARMAAEHLDIPLIIGGEEVRTGRLGKVVQPHNHQAQLAISPEH